MALRDTFEQAALSVTSPTGLIHLDATGSGEIVVSISDGALQGWSVRGLEREIVGTVDAALRETRRMYTRWYAQRPLNPGTTRSRAGRVGELRRSTAPR